MTPRSHKFSTVAAAIVIAFCSIYASVVTTFTTSNNTSQTILVTLQMQSGANQDINVAPAQTIPTNLNGDAVTGMIVFGAIVPAGSNAIVPNPTGGTIKVMWMTSRNADGSTNVAGGSIDPNLNS